MADSRASVVEMLRENWFWTGIFRDHAMFLATNLAPDEDQPYRWAKGFQQAFERLSGEAESLAKAAGVSGPAGSYALAGPPPDEPLASMQGAELTRYEQQSRQITRAVQEALAPLKAFKEEVIQKKLDCTIKLALGPSLIAHMVVEAEEAQRVLGRVRDGAPLPPAMESLHHHLVWLPDASGHAGVLHGGLDATEQKLLEVTGEFKEIFNGMHIKALELYSMLRVAPRMVGALRRLNADSMAQIGLFRAFLTELREHLQDCQALVANLMPQIADHMLREELYYTEKIMQIE